MTAVSATMPALTIYQPWAGFITWLGKNPENRGWPCPPKYIGCDIAIHAAAKVDEGPYPMSGFTAEQYASLFATSAEYDAWRFWCLREVHLRRRDTANWPAKLVLGAVVAVAEITGCHEFTAENLCGPAFADTSPTTPGICSPWAAFQQWHWEIGNIRPLARPVECRGYQRIWHLPGQADAEVRAQLEVAA